VVGNASVSPAGDFDAFYAAAYPRLVATLSRLSPGGAEEVAQDVFVRLLPRWEKVSRYDNPEAWLRRVGFRLLATHARRRTVLAHLPRHSRWPATSPGADVDVGIGDLVRRLPMGQRQVVVLYYLVDLPVEQVASELGISTGTVKSRLSRARAALREMAQT
jgi:RNA polymerase sigma-70 factor (ECF subfamily)